MYAYCRCFLSAETKAVGSIIESLLQCALDFRSCLTTGAWDTGSDQGNLLGKVSAINLSQVNRASYTSRVIHFFLKGYLIHFKPYKVEFNENTRLSLKILNVFWIFGILCINVRVAGFVVCGHMYASLCSRKTSHCSH